MMLHSLQINISLFLLFFFFFNDTATTEIYTLSLHDALPIYAGDRRGRGIPRHRDQRRQHRSEEHTSELQSQSNLVCRLLLEKKKNITYTNTKDQTIAKRINNMIIS